MLAIFLGACGPDKATEEKTNTQEASFTFFGIGANVRYTDDLRDRLRSQLGTDAIERLSTIDLSLPTPELLAAHFPTLARIDAELNQPPLRRRTRHKTVKLMYRYAFQKNLPFDYVELLFSGYSRAPLMITIRSKKDLSDIRQTLQDKYGSPEVIQSDENTPTLFFWQINRDYLIMSRGTDRLGRAEYLIRIYFVEHFNELVNTEAQQRQQEEERRRKAEDKAF